MNLKQILSEIPGSRDVLLKELYPKHKHPERALDRLLAGKTTASAEEVETIARVLGLNASDIISGGWKAKLHGNVHVLTHRDYTAIVNLSSGTVTISKNSEPIAEFALVSNFITLRELVNSLNKFVTDEN